MKEDWTDKLRQKLEGHQMTPPEGLWESISKELGIAEEPPVRQKASLVWLRWAAAAVVLALVGIFVFRHPDGDKALPDEPVAIATEKPQDQPVVTAKPSHEVQPITVPKAAHSSIPQIHQALALQTISPSDSTVLAQNVVSDTAKSDTAEESQSETPSHPTSDALPSYPEPQTASAPHPRQRHSDGKWTVDLNASGGLLAANTSSHQEAVYYHGIGYSGDESSGGTNSNGYIPISDAYILTDYVSEHHLPLRVGLNLRYQLSPRVALLSGVNYTYLYSQFRIPLYQKAVYDQKLHYLGVPLGVAWQLWQTGSFRFYVSASTLLEKCLNDKPWQWSVNAAAGAEYGISRQVGFYLEPSLGYYFDDGTPLEHYYKEHPFAPTIEFGLRLHLNE